MPNKPCHTLWRHFALVQDKIVELFTFVEVISKELHRTQQGFFSVSLIIL